MQLTLPTRPVALSAFAAASLAFALYQLRRRLFCSRSRDSKAQPAVATGLPGLIGSTPLVRIASLSELTGCEIYAKAEHLNPGGSAKDRVALRIVCEAEADGRLRPGGTLVEGTAGSTGISLALLARARGYHCIIVMPDDMAAEKETLLRTLGAEVRRVPAVSIVNPGHFCRVAEALAHRLPNALYVDQFENLGNFRAHRDTTGEEIWRQTGGQLDAFVMSAGTGGTLGGVAAALKAKASPAHIALVDPPGSALFLKVASGVLYAPEQAERRLQRHRYDTMTEGIGIDRLTANFAAGLPYITHAFRGTDQEAVEMAYFLLRNDGLFIGSSSAMNCVGAVRMARLLGPGHVVVTCLCDGGARGLSKLYNAAFLAERGLTPQSTGRDLSFVSSDPATAAVVAV